MQHSRFQDHRTSGSGEEDFLKLFTIYGHGGHILTLTIYVNVCSPFPRRLHIKFYFDWPSGLKLWTDDDGRADDDDDGRRVSYKLTYEPLAQVS